MSYLSNKQINLGYGLDFDGVDEYADIQNVSLVYPPAQAFTIECWVFMQQDPDNVNNFLSLRDSSITTVARSSRIRAQDRDNMMFLDVEDINGNRFSMLNAGRRPFTSNIGNWYNRFNHLVYIKDNLTTGRMYWNGEQIATTSTSSLNSNIVLNFAYLGTGREAIQVYQKFSQTFYVRMYETALSSSQITQAYKFGKKPTGTNPIIDFDFNKRPLVDSVGNIEFENKASSGTIGDARLVNYTLPSLGYSVTTPYLPDPGGTLRWYYYNDLTNPETKYIGY